MGSLTRRARRRGTASSAAEVREERSRRREGVILKGRSVGYSTTGLATEHFRRALRRQTGALVMPAGAQLELLDPPTEPWTDAVVEQPEAGVERNLPAEYLDALGKRCPWLVGSLTPAPPGVAALIEAAKEREVEIIQARLRRGAL